MRWTKKEIRLAKRAVESRVRVLCGMTPEERSTEFFTVFDGLPGLTVSSPGEVLRMLIFDAMERHFPSRLLD